METNFSAAVFEERITHAARHRGAAEGETGARSRVISTEYFMRGTGSISFLIVTGITNPELIDQSRIWRCDSCFPQCV